MVRTKTRNFACKYRVPKRGDKIVTKNLARKENSELYEK